MAPDKIYRTITYLDNDRGKVVYKEIPVKGAENIEYIRKDALLEWLQKEYETNKWFYETHAKPNELHTGRCEAYKRVINKIESL